MKPTIHMAYLASPYSAPKHLSEMEATAHRESRYAEVMHASAWLLSQGIHTISPILHNHDLAKNHALPHDAAFWKTYNEKLIAAFRSTIILCAEGWSRSRGVQDELTFTEAQAFDLHFLIPTKRLSDELSTEYILTDQLPALA